MEPQSMQAWMTPASQEHPAFNAEGKNWMKLTEAHRPQVLTNPISAVSLR